MLSHYTEKSLQEMQFRFKAMIFAVGGLLSLFREGTIICFIFGSIIIIMHAAGVGFKYLSPLAVVLALVLMLISALWRGRCCVPEDGKLMALFDSRSPAGGLLVSRLETDLGGWGERIELPELPRVSCRFGNRPLIFLLALGFMIAGCFTSNMRSAVSVPAPMDVAADVDKLAEQIKILNEEQVITDQERLEFNEQLKNLASQASGEDPLKTWEGLDHLNRAVMEKSAVAAETTLNNLTQMELLEKTASMLSSAESTVPSAEFSRALEGFQSLLNNLCNNNAAVNKMCDGKPGSQCENSTGLKNLQSKCAQNAEGLKRSLENLRRCSGTKAGPGGSNMPSQQQALQDLQDFIKKNTDSSGGKCLGKMCMKPGDGGTSRGRGDAPLTWDKRELSHDGKYKEITLPPADEAGLQDSTLLGITSAAPQVEKTRAVLAPGQLKDSAGKAEMSRLAIQPCHRKAVGRYFDHRQSAMQTSK